MSKLSKIDELIRERAMNEAKFESATFMKALPFWRDDITVWSDTVKKEVSIERWRLINQIQQAVTNEIYRDKVQELSKKVLSAIDELDWLRDSVEALERN